MHDWGGVGLALAQRFPERIEKLVLFTTVPLLPGYRWHRTARGWRTPVIGELMMGFTTRWALRRELPRELADRAWEHFDQGTQRAILRLYRASPPGGARAQPAPGSVSCAAPALILWPDDDPYIGASFGQALRGRARRRGRARARRRQDAGALELATGGGRARSERGPTAVVSLSPGPFH